MKRCDLTKGLVFFLTIIITLCCGLIPSSWAEDNAVCGCTNKSLKGFYGFSQSGSMIVPWHSEPVLVGSVGYFIANGKGIISGGRETLRIGSHTINVAELEGTYMVNDDCMATAWITADKDTTEEVNMEISLVITGRGGEEVHLLTTSIDGEEEPLAMVGIATRSADD